MTAQKTASVTVSGNLLQPLIRRTNDIVRVVLAGMLLVVVIVCSVITRYEWVPLERSISGVIGVLPPGQSTMVYSAYGIAIVALPFAILVRLIISQQWKLLGAYSIAGISAILPLSIHSNGIAAPDWHFDLSAHLQTTLGSFLDDPRWIAMLAAMLTVSGPWLPPTRRHRWWALLLAFVPIHLVVSAIVPARSLLGLSVGWFIGAIVVLVVGTPALEVPLEGAILALSKVGYHIDALQVVRPAGPGPLVLSASSPQPVIVKLYGPNQRSGRAFHQLWRKLRLRTDETSPLHASMRRDVEHRALMTIAIDAIGLSNMSTAAVASLDRGWTLYAHTPCRGQPLADYTHRIDAQQVWMTLRDLHTHQISHGDLCAKKITIDDDGHQYHVLFGGSSSAEFGATDIQRYSDIAQLLVTTTALYGAYSAVKASLSVFDTATIVTAARRLTRSALPGRVRNSVADIDATINACRKQIKQQTGTKEITTTTITRFSPARMIQLVLLFVLVYIAYPFLSALPTFFTQLHYAHWWWALAGLVASSLTYVGAASAIWACANQTVSLPKLLALQFANTFAATTTPAGVGWLALTTRFLQKSGLTTLRATVAVALQQTVQVIVHISLLIIFTTAAGVSANLSHLLPEHIHLVPPLTLLYLLYLIVGLALGVIGTFVLIPTLRNWVRNAITPRLSEISTDLKSLVKQPQRLAITVAGATATTLGSAAALWASIEAFSGRMSFIAVTVVFMIGGTLASAAPTPGGIGAVEAALIGGLAACGLPAAIGVPAVLLYRVLTCWIPVGIGWPTISWLTRHEMI